MGLLVIDVDAYTTMTPKTLRRAQTKEKTPIQGAHTRTDASYAIRQKYDQFIDSKVYVYIHKHSVLCIKWLG